MRRIALLAVAAAALLGSPASSGAATELKRAERATGLGVLCFQRTEWRSLEQLYYPGSGDFADGFWLYQWRWIGLSPESCRALKNWRYVAPNIVGGAIFVLGHEWAHSFQHGGLPPFSEADEHAADCWSDAHFAGIKRALNITRRAVTNSPSGC